MAVPNYTFLKMKMSGTHRHAGSFEPAEGIKKVPLDPSHPDDKALQISANLDGK